VANHQATSTCRPAAAPAAAGASLSGTPPIRQTRGGKAGEDRSPDLKAAIAELDREKAAILQKFQDERARLEAAQKQALAAVEARKAELLGRPKERPRKRPDQAGGAEKLDKILERLDAIEKRLDRIEKGKP
jgi:hypothetical protein